MRRRSVKIETLLEAHYRETFDKWLETERIICMPSFRLPTSIHPASNTAICPFAVHGGGRRHEQAGTEADCRVDRPAECPLAAQKYCASRVCNQRLYQALPDILIMTQSGKLICAETKGEHLKNDDSREKIALGQAWRTAAGKDFRYYMVFENEENLLPGAMSMSQFIDTVKAL